MSLKEEERRIIVEMELDKAERIFAEQKLLRDGALWGTLANRLYYALFHAVSALLISEGYEVGTHKGAVIRFQQYFVKTKLFSVDDGRFYSQMQTMRENADYNCSYDVSEEEVLERIEPTRLLIEKIKQYIYDKTK